jgi:tripartite-type tricarboxylate transporter receptor subunit TctC
MTQPRWSRSTTLLACCVLANIGVQSASAAYPDKPVHMIVPFAPGGVTDLLARTLAQKLGQRWNLPVIVENRPGGNGTVAESYVARAAPDGYTLIVVITSHTVAPSDHQYTLNYDPIKGFTPIVRLGSTPEVLVVNPVSLPVKSVKELIAAARAKPGALNFGSAGTYTPGFLNMALFMHATGIDMMNVNYLGSGPVLTAVLRGDVPLTFGTIAESLAQVKAGKLRALAVSGAKRSPLAPNVPTLAEAVAATDPAENEMLSDETAWYGALAPGGTPRPIVSRLHDDMVAALKDPAVQARLADQGFELDGSSPDAFADFIRKDIAKWTQLRETKVIH